MIKIILSATLTLLMAFNSYSQEFELVSTLSNTTIESSGLIHISNRLFTHNDSGDNPHLYEISKITGEVVRTITINGAKHMDWEDMCSDDTHVFIADMGNNAGSRTDLLVYKIRIEDLLSKELVDTEEIHFSYADQFDFTSTDRTTEFDAEAIVTIEDKLYIFTKNWTSYRTNIYELPKSPGTYSISRIKEIEVGGLITGGVYNQHSNSVLLVGYELIFVFLSPFMIEISGITNGSFEGVYLTKSGLNVPSGMSPQIESITHNNVNGYYITAEESPFGASGLYTLSNGIATNNAFVTKKVRVRYPTQTQRNLIISYPELTINSIYGVNGSLLIKTEDPKIITDHLQRGMYILRISDTSNQILLTEKFIVQ